MNPSVPPTLPSSAKRKPSTSKTIMVIFGLGALIILLIIMVPMITGMIFGTSMMSTMLANMGHLEIKNATDTFQVKILEVKNQSNDFSERVSIRCSGDMDAGIWVTDLKKAGIFESNGPNGEIIYREGHPYKIGQSTPIHSKDGFSTTEILFRVTTTTTNTAWHSEVAGGHCDTSLPSPLLVSDIQTNWTGSYERHTDIPLASLGDFKILVSIK